MGLTQNPKFQTLIVKVFTFIFVAVTPIAFADDPFGIDLFRGDYSPPSPPQPPQPPHKPSLSCDGDLGGTGSLDTRCDVNSSLDFSGDVFIEGSGSLYVQSGAVLRCPKLGCFIYINVSRDFVLGSDAMIVGGSVTIGAGNASFVKGSVVNVSALAGDPPSQTSGSPSGVQGGGGGYGGRGASCVKDNTKSPDDVWGGDAYSWSSLNEPRDYGSRGGTTSKEVNYGGEGGGRIWVKATVSIDAHGSFLANGGNSGTKGGGGSGGSIFIGAPRMTGGCKLSAAGGNGYAGGGGGRISVQALSRHDDSEFFVHGGRSFGCPENSGASGTYYDAVPRTLFICNRNLSTNSDTILLEFPKQPLWTNIYIQNHAKSSVPLFWGRVQVRGKIQISAGSTLSFGLAHYSNSEFELMAEELLMSESVVMVYGALRMSVKMHLMWNSKLSIDGGADVATSVLEASNLVVLKESSLIQSNANLGVHGQGHLNLSGPGNLIEAQRLILSLFYSITIEPGSGLRGPLNNSSSYDVVPRLYCEYQGCPMELLHPPEDCNVNSSLAFTLQICRVEDITVEGTITGSVVHIHWVRTVTIRSSGVITASGLGCSGGIGRGQVFDNGIGSGGGHGGKGGDGYYNGNYIQGGVAYGDANLPCELGSGSGNDSLGGTTAGGGIIVMGSLAHSLTSMSIDGSLRADGESYGENIRGMKSGVVTNVGPGGGSGGTILLFVHALKLSEASVISAVGGNGSPSGSGGGGGGRVHFHWSEIPTGDEYLPLTSIKGEIQMGGGLGGGKGLIGQNGTVTGKACPKGLYGIFCEECPVGTYKNVSGSDRDLCNECPSHELPHRAKYIAVRGGVAETPCPYKCISERYHMPNCYTALEELIYTFGGPWLFGLILSSLLILLALVLSFARMKFVSGEETSVIVPSQRPSRLGHSLPFLESLNEVLETNRTDESHNHVHRMYFMGPNTFSEPWHLTHCPPKQIMKIVYEDAFNRFVDEINSLAAYQWWEGSVYSILSILAYPLAWLWLQMRRKNKIQRLREYVRSEYDHACLRSCRSRALYEGLKVASTSDYMLAHVDFFLGGDEKRDDLPPRFYQRLPMPVIFGGDGSYMAPFSLNNDNILTSLMSQAVPPTIWYRLVAGLNAQLRLVRRGRLKRSFTHVTKWLETHANPTLSSYGVRADLALFQPTASGYSQYGLLVCAADSCSMQPAADNEDGPLLHERRTCLLSPCNRGNSPDHVRINENLRVGRRTIAFLLHAKNLCTIKERAAICYPFLFIINNVKPIGHQDLVGLFISILLLGDFSLVLLTFLQLYSISMLDFFLVLLILPLGLLSPFPVGINALFSHGPKRSAALARIYALWDITSLVNVVVAFICGFIHYKSNSSKMHLNIQSWNISMDERGWWMLPSGLLLCKIIQARLIDYHIANQEIQDQSLYSDDPDVFWQS